jgi:hypothetical protein
VTPSEEIMTTRSSKPAAKQIFKLFNYRTLRCIGSIIILKGSDDGVLHLKNHVYGLRPSSNVFFNTIFRKLDLFPSSGKNKMASTWLGPLDKASLNHWINHSIT